MTEAAGLIEKYKGAQSGDSPSTAEVYQKIAAFVPDWEKYESTRQHAAAMKLLEFGASAIKTKAIIQGHMPILHASLATLSLQDEKPVQWVLTLFYELLREDSSSFSLFDEAMKEQSGVYKPLMQLLLRPSLDPYVADKAAWLLSAVIGNLPGCVRDADVTAFLAKLLEPEPSCTDLGVLDAIANLLKADSYRKLVFKQEGLSDRIFRIQPKTAAAPFLYKSVFAIWMLSFDADLKVQLKSCGVVKKLKDIPIFSRVEKVIRLVLTLLKNLLSNKSLCEDMVEEGLLEAVQQLEYEKWRDTELYDDIREMATLIATEVNEMSNFERYERELHSGTLAWGFIHSAKFWSENVMKFEQNDFRALKMLAQLLLSDATDATTLAVACHDIGEFVALHPLGKKKVAQLQVKEKVMQLMSSDNPNYREVRREALLCCQKIMLNKWQDMDSGK